ncbi:MAG: hypothetical protein H7Z39_14165 [Burkholderiaceae bacterium]|nr:hypothetical protein [Burkholderiaceae bacterium]
MFHAPKDSPLQMLTVAAATIVLCVCTTLVIVGGEQDSPFHNAVFILTK